MTQPAAIYSPFNGVKLRQLQSDLAGWRFDIHRWHFNPWTGTKRHVDDVESDPHGLAIYEPAWGSMRAATLQLTAPDLLAKAAQHMRDRAVTYDKPEGERSMGRAVAAFNAITGRDLQESEGWLLLQVLKDVRDRQRPAAHTDSLEDNIAYSALKAEARLAGR